MKLIHTTYGSTLDPQKVLNLIRSLNKKLPNLELFILDFIEKGELIEFMDFGVVGRTADEIKKKINYKHKLAAYKGNMKVELNHCIDLNMIPKSRDDKPIKKYYMQLKKAFPDLENIIETNYQNILCKFWESEKITEKIERKVEIKVTTDF